LQNHIPEFAIVHAQALRGCEMELLSVAAQATATRIGVRADGSTATRAARMSVGRESFRAGFAQTYAGIGGPIAMQTSPGPHGIRR